MRVFISWSGERSGKVATALQQWLPRVVQAVSPWLSSSSIDPGARWSDEIASALEDLQCGILCLTPENVNSSWILFETGAISKAVSKSRVIPYPLGFEPRELQGPLAQFQAIRADKQGTLLLLNAINTAEGTHLLEPELLNEAFQLWWPKLDGVLNAVVSLTPAEPPPPPRPLEDMVGEVLELLRSEKFVETSLDHRPASLLSTSPSTSSVGSRIRKARIDRDLPQKFLAYEAGVSLSYISQIETGRANPSLFTLVNIARALGVPVEFLLEGFPNVETERESAT